MATENSGLGDLNQNTLSPASQDAKKKNEKNPMVELMEALQPMVNDINGVVNRVVGVDAAKGLVEDAWNNLSSAFSQNNENEATNTSGNELSADAKSDNTFLSSMADTSDMNSVLGNVQLDSARDSPKLEPGESSGLEESALLAL